MTTITVSPAAVAESWTGQCFDLSPRQQRRAERAQRRHQARRRRHDLEVRDDRYLDRTGPALSPLAVAMIWQR